ncbi:hypothetical protein EWB00_009632 [Schistosoma japonicum]|uniref:Uncharacterized protein n=1 Tax=Schistosoma japonicum TaxID=6182 RepID=C1LEK0_SCHJA|nr:hypothetical protein EWB00_009632 [Schistosoma japonicum]CAX73128.1 hypothetical protein [Schistosoma japonicum]
MVQASQQIFPLSDHHLLQLAIEFNDRWEHVFRQGLTSDDENPKSSSAACLPKSQIEICRNLAPKDYTLQGYFALARWRWFCASVGCTNKQALGALTNAVKASGLLNTSANLQAMNNMSTSLEYV